MKGTSKRVVVVKSPDPRVFEQAIFIVREDFLKRKDGEKGDVLKEAQAVADEYIRNAVPQSKRFLNRLPPAGFAAFGAILTGCVWLLLHFAGI